MTSPLSPRESFRVSLTSPQLNTIIDEFSRQLTEVAQRAAAEQSQELLREAFAVLQAEEQQPSPQRKQWLEDLTQQMIAAIGQIMQDTGNERVRNELARRSAQATQGPPQASGIVRRRAPSQRSGRRHMARPGARRSSARSTSSIRTVRFCSQPRRRSIPNKSSAIRNSHGCGPF